MCPIDAEATTIAHEVLHLFGAVDLYQERYRHGALTNMMNSARTFIHRLVANHIGEHALARDIMHNPHSHNGVMVSQPMAYSVGWCAEPL